MAFEWGIVGTLYRIAKDAFNFLSRRFKPTDPAEVLKHRNKWKVEFEGHRTSLRKQNIIVRDLARMDAYPDIDSKEKGISPWFKTQFKDLSHRGFEVYLDVKTIKPIGDKGWVYCDQSDPAAVKAFLVGKISYDVVTGVDWDGDEYYQCPHVYCRFSGKKRKQPYESIVFCQVEAGGSPDWHPEVTDLDSVLKLSKKHGVRA